MFIEKCHYVFLFREERSSPPNLRFPFRQIWKSSWFHEWNFRRVFPFLFDKVRRAQKRLLPEEKNSEEKNSNVLNRLLSIGLVLQLHSERFLDFRRWFLFSHSKEDRPTILSCCCDTSRPLNVRKSNFHPAHFPEKNFQLTVYMNGLFNLIQADQRITARSASANHIGIFQTLVVQIVENFNVREGFTKISKTSTLKVESTFGIRNQFHRV